MRFGWLAAAAAMVFAMPADAARFYEFQIIGATTPTYFDPFGINPPVTLRRTSTFELSFDTAAPGAPYPLSFDLRDQSVALSRTLDHLFTYLPRPGDTFFDFGFGIDLANLGAGPVFQQLTPTGSYGYTNCSNRYRVCTQTLNGSYVVLARTSDVAPAFIGARETLEFGAVPEPAAWTMMIAGIGAVGATMRRRRSARIPAVSA